MSKYDPLSDFLKSKNHDRVPMTFEELERLIDDTLPPSARKHRAWWSNNPSNSVITRAWLDAGYITRNVDLGGERLVFRRAAQPESGAEPTDGADPRRRSIFWLHEGNADHFTGR